MVGSGTGHPKRQIRGQPEAVDVHELPQPWPGGVVQAHQVAAVHLVPGEFLPWVLCAAACLVEVVVDSRILIALDQERVEAGAGARGPLGRQVDVPQQLAVVRVVHVHRPKQLEYGRRDLREHVTLDRGDVIVKAGPQEVRIRVAVDRRIVVRCVKRGERATER